MSWSALVANLGRELLLDDPWMAGVWLACAKKPCQQGDIALAAAPDGQITLLFSDAFWVLPLDEQLLRLRHEVLHLVLGHWAQLSLFSDVLTARMAADLAVVALTGESLPNDLTPTLAPHKTSLTHWYTFLRKHTNWQEAWQNEQHRLYRYRFWLSPGHLTNRESMIETQRLRTTGITALRRASSYGQDRGWQRILLAQATPPAAAPLPWRRILRSFLRQTGQTQLSHTHRRPSRRYGTTPGLRITRNLRLAVIIDTSASIAPQHWQLFFREVGRIKGEGAHIRIIEADTIVQRRWIYHRGIPKYVAGGGGTTFDPALRRAEAERPDAILYFTDGDGPSPRSWQGTPLLWVLTRANDRLPGRQILLPMPEEVYLS